MTPNGPSGAAGALPDRSGSPAFGVRAAGVADIAVLARHRTSMFRDMGTLPGDLDEPLQRATAAYLHAAIPRGEYLAWVAEDRSAAPSIVGGACVQLRPMLPRMRDGGGIEPGPEALVVNVYVEPAWRRRGVAETLMRTLLDDLARRGVRRIVLHASAEGRRLYERLGFVPTNEMRLVRS
jgi:ribosomal protein S18 acetylase RimI-like enzyme